MEFDYIIAGGGSAGCALARRLSDDPSLRVCLLEAGTRDTSPLIHMPAGVVAILPGKYKNWAFETVPQTGLNGRIGYQPRGKVLGGSSSINAMLYIRGHRTDYDDWAALGNDGWSYDDVLPYFKRAENQERGGDDFHGVGGPLNVADLRSPNKADAAFIEATQQLQLPQTPDFNGAEQEGVSPYQVTQLNGERCSAAKAYITPVLDRPNLEVIVGAKATRILFKDKRAEGVEFIQGGVTRQVRAAKEVIVSSGAFQSPQLLMLSGIGPGEVLKQHGIEVLHDLPGVGQNLQDHLDYVTAYRTKDTDFFGVSFGGAPKMVKALYEYVRHRRGRLTTSFAEVGAFLKTDPTLSRPDIQLHFIVATVDDHGRKFRWGHGYSCHVCILRPKSKGSVSLCDKDPLSAPVIDPNFLGEEEDLKVMVDGFKIMRRILEAPALAPYRGEELYTANVHSDEEIANIIRQRADTVYHPVGTCKMGSDPMAVVSNRLKVHGIDRLRVVDASIMPTLVGGNTNAPSIMIGERASDMILEDRHAS